MLLAILYKHDSRTNVIYVYDSKSYRDPITGKPKSHRKLIGKLDDDGNIIDTRKRKTTNPPPSTKENAETMSNTASTTTLAETLRQKDAQIMELKKRVSNLEKRLRSIADLASLS